MRSFSAFLLLLLASLSTQTLADLLVIDYGAEWTKACLMKPGMPFDVLLDRDSKRKMFSAVGWKRDERVFGGEAVNAAGRFPLAHFPYIKPLLAATSAPDSTIYPVTPVSTESGIVFPHAGAPADARIPDASETDAVSWSPEELLAQQLAYVRYLAEESAKGPVTDLFLTVPSYFTQHQRRAFRDAADIAGLNVVGMISEGAAVGLNYALTRSFPEREIHLVYDSGAVKTTATVLSFETRPEELPLLANGKKPKRPRVPNNSTHIDVLGFASEEQLGGVNIDEVIRELMIADFEAGKGKGMDVRSDPRAMRRLWKEAGRAKMVLSANQETTLNIESLTNDIDFRSKLTRTQLEEASAAFAGKFGSPIDRALKQAGLSVDQLTSVILFGGNTRVPMVQSAIKEHIGADKIAQNVNTDEAAVLGAAYYGASTSRQFRAKVDLKLQEVTGYEVSYSVDGNDQGVVFPIGTNLTQRQALNLTGKGDHHVAFRYSGANAPQPADLLDIELLDVSAGLANLTEQDVSDAVVRLNVKIDQRGLLHAVNAVAIGETKGDESLAGKLMGLFGGAKDKGDADKGDSDDKDKELEKELQAELARPKERKVAIRFRETPLGVKPATLEARKQAKNRLAAIRRSELDRSAREEARNILEGFLYRLQRVLEGEETQALKTHGTEAEQEALSTGVKRAFAWLGENADTADAAALRKQRTDLEAIELPIVNRYREAKGRPQAIENFQKAMFLSRQWFVEARTNMTEVKNGTTPRWTDSELDTVEEMLKDNEKWMNEMVEKQNAVVKDPTAEPVLLIADLESRGKRLQTIVQTLQRKPVPKPPRTTSTKTTATRTATEEPAQTPAAEDEPVATPEAEPQAADYEPVDVDEPVESQTVPVHEEL